MFALIIKLQTNNIKDDMPNVIYDCIKLQVVIFPIILYNHSYTFGGSNEQVCYE